MNMLTKLAEYSLVEIKDRYQAAADIDLTNTWPTHYFELGDKFVILADVSSAPIDLSAPENRFDVETARMQIVGKPHSHSDQASFRKLFKGEISLEVFVRWKRGQVRFMYLGAPSIIDAKDNLEVGQAATAIMLEVSFFGGSEAQADGGPDGVQEKRASTATEEGRLITVLVNRYERDPALRSACLELFGPNCVVCGFDFLATYGELGRDFCHIHHIKPLSEVGREHKVDPRKDLVPVCPNCHAMLHRCSPALQPDDLRKLLRF